MGTNYYIRKETNKCEHCGRSDEEEIHVGKSSHGWRFLWNPRYPSFIKWIPVLFNSQKNLFDEYGERMCVIEFIAMVDSMQNNPVNPEWTEHEYYDEDGYRFSKFEEFS